MWIQKSKRLTEKGENNLLKMIEKLTDLHDELWDIYSSIIKHKDFDSLEKNSWRIQKVLASIRRIKHGESKRTVARGVGEFNELYQMIFYYKCKLMRLSGMVVELEELLSRYYYLDLSLCYPQDVLSAPFLKVSGFIYKNISDFLCSKRIIGP